MFKIWILIVFNRFFRKRGDDENIDPNIRSRRGNRIFPRTPIIAAIVGAFVGDDLGNGDGGGEQPQNPQPNPDPIPEPIQNEPAPAPVLDINNNVISEDPLEEAGSDISDRIGFISSSPSPDVYSDRSSDIPSSPNSIRYEFISRPDEGHRAPNNSPVSRVRREEVVNTDTDSTERAEAPHMQQPQAAAPIQFIENPNPAPAVARMPPIEAEAAVPGEEESASSEVDTTSSDSSDELFVPPMKKFKRS